jgi:hypothetical protein
MFSVFVVPNAKKAAVEKEGDVLRVRLTSPPEKGKANKELIDVLADYFSVRKSDVKIVSGLKSRNKTVQIRGT